jgi:DNA-binding NarL/FixJ family response regulator
MAHIPDASRDFCKSIEATAILCGETLAIRRIHESLQKAATLPVYIAPEFANAVTYAREQPPCVIVAEKDVLHSVDLINLHLHFLRKALVQILVVTSGDDEAELRRMLRLGYAGFLHSSASGEEIVKAVQCVNNGEIWASRKIISGALHESVAAPNHGTKLTSRETEILLHIAAGHGNQWIAEQLFITRDTVRWHLRSAYAKLGIHDRQQAARFISASNT